MLTMHRARCWVPDVISSLNPVTALRGGYYFCYGIKNLRSRELIQHCPAIKQRQDLNPGCLTANYGILTAVLYFTSFIFFLLDGAYLIEE